MNEDDFAALNEHLRELRPIFDEFCAHNGFVYVDRISLGRYPRVRIERSGAVNIWFDLWMQLDKNGKRFEQFRRDLPYELSAGAYVDVQDGSKYGIRLQKSFQCFSGKPFDRVGAILKTEMQGHLLRLENWDVQYLRDNGERVQLGN